MLHFYQLSSISHCLSLFQSLFLMAHLQLYCTNFVPPVSQSSNIKPTEHEYSNFLNLFNQFGTLDFETPAAEVISIINQYKEAQSPYRRDIILFVLQFISKSYYCTQNTSNFMHVFMHLLLTAERNLHTITKLTENEVFQKIINESLRNHINDEQISQCLLYLIHIYDKLIPCQDIINSAINIIKESKKGYGKYYCILQMELENKGFIDKSFDSSYFQNDFEEVCPDANHELEIIVDYIKNYQTDLPEEILMFLLECLPLESNQTEDIFILIKDNPKTHDLIEVCLDAEIRDMFEHLQEVYSSKD